MLPAGWWWWCLAGTSCTSAGELRWSLWGDCLTTSCGWTAMWPTWARSGCTRPEGWLPTRLTPALSQPSPPGGAVRAGQSLRGLHEMSTSTHTGKVPVHSRKGNKKQLNCSFLYKNRASIKYFLLLDRHCTGKFCVTFVISDFHLGNTKCFSVFSTNACPDFVLLYVFASLTTRIHAPLPFLVINNDPPFHKMWVLKLDSHHQQLLIPILSSSGQAASLM